MPELRHGFLGRRGGISKGPYESLNLAYGIGDDPAALEENWRRFRKIIGEHTPVARLEQVHGKIVRTINRANVSEWPQGDGMVTTEPGIILRILSADCVPILMIDRRGKIVAAIHAGWRGTIAGIAAESVLAMERLGAEASGIRAALGPSIGPCCFEVDQELAARFAREVEGADRHTRAGRLGKSYLDLRGIITHQLMRAGLPRESITNVGPCTRCANDRYFSRRAANPSGLQASFIGIPADESYLA
jgi:YfiH family protein